MRAALGHTASSGVFTRQQREISILTIRTGCVGGTTRVCRVRVCLPVCALISHSAAVGGKVKVKGGETSGRQSGASLKVRAATQRDCCDLNFKIRIVIFFLIRSLKMCSKNVFPLLKLCLLLLLKLRSERSDNRVNRASNHDITEYWEKYRCWEKPRCVGDWCSLTYAMLSRTLDL